MMMMCMNKKNYNKFCNILIIKIRIVNFDFMVTLLILGEDTLQGKMIFFFSLPVMARISSKDFLMNGFAIFYFVI